MNQQTLSQQGALLLDSLQRVEAYEKQLIARRDKDTIHIPTVGSKLSTAYEQLRNASEYSEGDLLQQRAIRRYLKRELSFHVKLPTSHLAEELITELTQAEYLPNDRTVRSDIKTISHHIKQYYDAYWTFASEDHRPSKRSEFQSWILDVLSVRCEQTLSSHIRQLLFAHFAQSYLTSRITTKKLRKNGEKISDDDMPIVLYVATHRALLKSDNATIRAALIDSYNKDIDDIAEFVEFNRRLERLFDTKTTVFATRIVSKNGAALRFVYSGFYAEDAPLTTHSLKSSETLTQSLHRHIENEYMKLDKRLDRGIIRSIFFLLITKGIVGFAIELPYDLLIFGTVLWAPLLVNLFFPAIFIAFTRATLTPPSRSNTSAVINQITAMLFDDNGTYKIHIPKERTSLAFNIAYAITFLLVFAGVSYILYKLQFTIVQGVIFFIFLSTASFLSFRLSRQINELEVVNSSIGSLSLLRDIVYMPFIYVGQTISYRYAQVNIAAMVLDILIELPLKTILRLIRQWTQFLNEKKDELI